MATKTFAPFDAVTLPTSTNGTSSRQFTVPQGAKSMTIILPDLVGVATTAKLQVGTPTVLNNEATLTFTDLTVFDLTDGSFEALDGLPESTAVVIPVTAVGGGILRFVTSAAQTGAADALTIYVVWGMEG